jgi:hypothetical protein
MPDTRTPKPRKEVAASVAEAVESMARAEATMRPYLDSFEATIKAMLSVVQGGAHPRLDMIRTELYSIKDQIRLIKKSINAFRRKSTKVGKTIFDPGTDMNEVLRRVRAQRTVLRDLQRNYGTLNKMKAGLTDFLEGAKRMTAAELEQSKAKLKRRTKRLRKARRTAKQRPT